MNTEKTWETVEIATVETIETEEAVTTVAEGMVMTIVVEVMEVATGVMEVVTWVMEVSEVDHVQERGIEDVPDPGHVKDLENTRL